jgi:ABC-2 type transport system ATP-binding protein
MIESNNLTKCYNNVAVLNIPQLKINQGESFGLVGNNGEGKTTFFSLLLDIIKTNSGCVLSKGKNVKMSEHWKEYTGSYLDESFIIDFLTPEEYFEFIGSLHGYSKEETKNKIQIYSDFFNGDVLNKKNLSESFRKEIRRKWELSGRYCPIRKFWYWMSRFLISTPPP